MQVGIKMQQVPTPQISPAGIPGVGAGNGSQGGTGGDKRVTGLCWAGLRWQPSPSAHVLLLAPILAGAAAPGAALQGKNLGTKH